MEIETCLQEEVELVRLTGTHIWLEGQVVREELEDKLKVKYIGIKTSDYRTQAEAILMGNRVGECESRVKRKLYVAFKT